MTEHKFSIDDMRECLAGCFDVDDDLLIPAACVADGDPAKFEKVLSHFTGGSYETFANPYMLHNEECPIRYMLLPDKFTLTIELGNAAMKEIEHIQKALEDVKRGLDCHTMRNGYGWVSDGNGHNVGKWELS